MKKYITVTSCKSCPKVDFNWHYAFMPAYCTLLQGIVFNKWGDARNERFIPGNPDMDISHDDPCKQFFLKREYLDEYYEEIPEDVFWGNRIWYKCPLPDLEDRCKNDS